MTYRKTDFRAKQAARMATRTPIQSRGFSPTRSALWKPERNPEIQDGDHE